MGNNQGGFHKRERTNDGSQRVSRLQSLNSNPLPLNSSQNDDGCPVQVFYIFFQIKLKFLDENC